MRVDPRDLVEGLTGQGGVPFQNFVHDLVVAEARTCRIPLDRIRYDSRVNVGDGGRDIIVGTRHSRRARFLPQAPSIWSVKAGDDGLEPSVLRREVNDVNHTELQDHLGGGGKYIWCALQPASQGQRDDMERAARALEQSRSLQPGLIEFRWNDALAAMANEYPGLISADLPHVAFALRGLMTFREWERAGARDYAVEWVDFDGRSAVVQRVQSHLLSQGGDNVLHIAGFSGIGKTRTVFQACRDAESGTGARMVRELQGVFYLGSYADLTPEMWRYLEEDDRHLRLVIDEVPLSALDGLIDRFAAFPDRLRVVTVGPALRMDSGRRAVDPNVLVLPEPGTEAGVLAVVRSAGEGLPEDVLRSIAEAASHDLRLALLLVRATRRNPASRVLPIPDLDGVWLRLAEMFRGHLGDADRFRYLYEVLTTSVDVGRAGRHAQELRYLADHFQVPLDELERAAHQAAECGLGVVTPGFFESAPRALAVQVFQDRVWARLSGRLSEFIAGMPERLRRRFIERCQECGGPAREAIQSALRGFFLSALRQGGLAQLADRDSSRLFQAWAEFDPASGLAWLRAAVAEAAPEQLGALRGDADTSGRWMGRRQLVWLCQNLAAFAEHFETCEDILFRLAHVETEPGIGNNATAVWASLFWPVLAYTEVPFGERIGRLLARLGAPHPESLPLLLAGAFGVLEYRTVGIPAPPRVVGGRLVPPPWQPRTWEELAGLVRDAGQGIVRAITALSPPLRETALASAIDHLGDLLRHGLLSEARGLLATPGLNEALRQRLVAVLERNIAFYRGHAQKNPRLQGPLAELERWRAELQPDDLPSQVRDLTAQDYWSTERAYTGRFPALAAAVVAAPQFLDALEGWFDGPDARSAGAFGLALGRQDGAGSLAPAVRRWLGGGRCVEVVSNYLRGVAERPGGLPGEWVRELDVSAAQAPASAALATLAADPTPRGLARLLGLVPHLPPPASPYLRRLAYPEWDAALSAGDKAAVLAALHSLAEGGDPHATGVALELTAVWSRAGETPLDAALADPLLRVAVRAGCNPDRVEAHDWEVAMRLLARHRPAEAAGLLVGALVGAELWLGPRRDGALEVLVDLARGSSQVVMDAVGGAILDPARRDLFRVLVFPGLFEAIGLAAIRGWVGGHGRDRALYIARHLASPHLDEAGTPVVPEVTEWFLSEFEGDEKLFQEFCMGRHSGEVREGPVRSAEELDRELAPFRSHRLRRVREWADYERRQRDWESEWESREDDEYERA